MKKVLLTGAGGFIGRQAIFPLLDKDYEVHALYNKASDLPRVHVTGVYWHRCNLLDEADMRKILASVAPSHLLHFAWYTEPGSYWSSMENIRWVRASLALLLAFTENHGQRAVCCGSCAEYDWSFGFCAEGVTPCKPASLYGCCKHSLQEMFACLCRESGLSGAWGRVFHCYGPHEHRTRLVPSVIASLLGGGCADCTCGEQMRDYLYVKDVAAALVALMHSDVPGPVNIASGQPVRLRRIISGIAEKLGCVNNINWGGLPMGPQEPPLVVADIRRLTREVGWSPGYDLDAGLEETIAWWRQANRPD